MSPEEENKLIDDAYQHLLNGYLSSNHRKKVEKIDKAFRFARRAHEGIRRRSGVPYILHPIAVATIVSQEIGLGSTSICAALLHDVVEDTEYTLDDIKAIFGDELVGETGEKVGEKVANIVEGLTKISGGIFGDKASAQGEWCSSRWPTACTTCAPYPRCLLPSNIKSPARHCISMLRSPTGWAFLPSRPNLRT